ncbi:hypothetical protein BHE74_00011120 [Ensete ventricosum]|nr:hypothetical protein BHE74_00011120 [Ensete ventricosum]
MPDLGSRRPPEDGVGVNGIKARNSDAPDDPAGDDIAVAAASEALRPEPGPASRHPSSSSSPIALGTWQRGRQRGGAGSEEELVPPAEGAAIGDSDGFDLVGRTSGKRGEERRRRGVVGGVGGEGRRARGRGKEEFCFLRDSGVRGRDIKRYCRVVLTCVFDLGYLVGNAFLVESE